MASDLDKYAPIPNNEKVTEAMQELRQMLEEDVPRIPESVFVNRLLPILTNTQEKQDLTVWLELAGNFQRPIDVVKGPEVLFRVPPLFRRLAAPRVQNSRNSVFEMVATAKQKSDQIPQLGERYLANRLADKVPKATFEKTDLDQWNAILARYGLPAVGSATPATSANPTAPGVETKPSDGFLLDEYDEL